jgi:hypothetical protein
MFFFKGLIPVLILAALMSACGYEELNPIQKQSLTIASDYLYAKDSLLFTDFTKKTKIKLNIIHLSTDSLSKKIIEKGFIVDFDMLMVSNMTTLETLRNKNLLQKFSSNIHKSNLSQHIILTGIDPIVFKSNRNIINDSASYNDLSEDFWYPVLNELDLKKLYNGIKNINEWSTRESALWLNQTGSKKLSYPLEDSLAPKMFEVGFLSQLERPNSLPDSLNTFQYLLFPNQLKTGLLYNYYGAGIVYQSRNFFAAMQMVEYLLQPNSVQIINDKIGIVTYDHKSKSGIYKKKKLILTTIPLQSYSFNLTWWNAHLNDAKNIIIEAKKPKTDTLSIIDTLSKGN